MKEATQLVYLNQEGVVMSMSLTESQIKAMNELRKQNPEQWQDRDLDLLKAVKKQ